jgi:hypothetical protein
MDVREKLAELLNGVQHYGTICAMSQMDDRYASITQVSNTEVAESLIAHGVTVQGWISTKDRLPEEWKKVLVFIPSIDAIIPAKLRGGSWYATWDSTRLEYVSCWMPMPEKPQPPKGD